MNEETLSGMYSCYGRGYMKKTVLFMMVMTYLLVLPGCASSSRENVITNSADVQESVDENESDIFLEAIENDNGQIERTDDSYEELPETEIKYITIDLSTVKEIHTEKAAATPLNLKVVSEEDNGVDDANDWYSSKNLSLPMIGDGWNRFYDDVYEYQWVGDMLEIYEKEAGNCLYVLEYPSDKWYINGNNAYLKDGIFYGASVMNGYAQPDTCFMFAYDLNKDELLWRSASQSYNTMNFVVMGDIILCGYGFTDEKDYLYQIDINTGEILAKTEIKNKPDLLVEQDGKLYVHAYSYNYIIEFE